MSAAATPTAPSDVSPVDAGSRAPLLLLLSAGLVWLVLSGIGALITSIQLHTPDFLTNISVLTVGRMQALSETAFIYGWIGNAGLGLVLWMLGRLSGEPLRAGNWAVVGALFWNLAIFLGEIGIATGSATGIPFLQMPAHVQPLLLVAYGAIGAAAVIAWTGRRRDRMFAAQWYAAAAVFLFPWILSIAQVMLLWSPVRGALQAIVAGWFEQSLWTLWMAPLALASAYYVVARVTGRVLPAYETALFAFWNLLFIGGFTGCRHLIDGPVPAWIPTVAIVTTFVLLVHYFIVFLNLRPALSGGGIALRFIGVGLLAYVLGGALDAITALRAVAASVQFTYFSAAQTQLALYGGISLMLLGALYFALPRIVGRPWASARLAHGHLILTVVGVALLVICLGVAGLVQADGLKDPAVSFAAIATQTQPWLFLASGGYLVLLLANLLLVVNFLQTVGASLLASARTVEAPA